MAKILKILALALVVELVFAACAFFISIIPHRETTPERLSINICNDVPLLTDEQKRDAKESGVGAYMWHGVWNVDRSLPNVYWLK